MHSKRLSTLDDLHLPPVAIDSVHLYGEPLSPISHALRSTSLNPQHRSPLVSHTLPPAAHLKSHPLIRKSMAAHEKGVTSKTDDTAASSSSGNMWDRYTFNVNFVFENIHIGAGLSSKKTSIPHPKHLFNHPFMAAPKNGGGSNGVGVGVGGGMNLGGLQNSALRSATVAAAFAPTANLTAHERVAHYQPILNVTTGTFSLSMRYRPKNAIKPMSIIEAAQSAVAAAAASTSIPSATSIPIGANGKPALRVNVDAAPNSEEIAARQSTKSLFKAEDGSNVIVEMTFQGVGLKMSTLAKHPSILAHQAFMAPLCATVNPLMSAPSPASSISSASASPPSSSHLSTSGHARRTLIECRADIRLRVGFKVNATYTHADCTFEQTLMKVTAIPITTTSLYLLASTYMKAYDDFQVEKARLVQEKEIRDPLIGLRALRAERVWNHLQSLPGIKHTISAAQQVTDSSLDAHDDVSNASIGVAAGRGHSTISGDSTHSSASGMTGHVASSSHHRRMPTTLETSSTVFDSHASQPDMMSPTSAANNLAVAAGQESPVQVGTGTMVMINPMATTPVGTKYELHFCMQVTELVLLFEKSGGSSTTAGGSLSSTAGVLNDVSISSYDPLNPFGPFNPYAYELLAELDPNHFTDPSTCTPQSLSALVVFLDQLDIQLEYAPPLPSASPFPLGVPRFPTMIGLGSSSSTHYSSLFMARPPVNSLGSTITVTGFELGCLGEDIPDTNILDDLASTLRKYRAPPTAAGGSMSTLSSPLNGATGATATSATNDANFDALNGGGSSTPMSLRDEAFVKRHPFRSFSLYVPSMTKSERTRPKHTYNRIVLQSTVFHVRGALPVSQQAAHDDTLLGARANVASGVGGSSSGTHSRHRSQNWSNSPLSAQQQQQQQAAAASPPSNEMTIVVDTSCTGAELDLDPSLVNHLSNLTSLVELFSNITPPSSSTSNVTDPLSNVTPRGSIVGGVGVGGSGGGGVADLNTSGVGSVIGTVGPSSTNTSMEGVRSPTHLRRTSSHGHPSGRASSASNKLRTRSLSRAHGHVGPRRRSLPSSSTYRSSDSDSDASMHHTSVRSRDIGSHNASFQSTSSHSHPHHHSTPASPHPTASASASAAAASAGADPSSWPHSTANSSPQPPLTPKLDLSVEFKLNVRHGRCCLHPLPKNLTTTTTTPNGYSTTSNRSSNSSNNSNSSLSDFDEEVYADFVLPSITSTAILQTVPKEEILLLLDLNLPPLTLNPSIMIFLSEVRLQLDKISSEAAVSGVSGAGLNSAATANVAPHVNDLTGLDVGDFDMDGSSPAMFTRMLRQRSSNNTAGGGGVVGGGSGKTGANLNGVLNTSTNSSSNTRDHLTETPTLTDAGWLATFVASCATAGRNITANIRMKPTYFKLNCLPMNDEVYLQFGSKRSIDICFSVTTLDQAKFRLPVAIPYVSCTVNVPAIFAQLGLAQSSSSSSSGTQSTPTFLDIRSRHMKLQVMEAYHIRTDGAPIRTVLFNVDHISPVVMTMNAMAAFVVFSKVWLIQTAANKTGGEHAHTSHANSNSTNVTPEASTTPSEPSNAIVPVKAKCASYYHVSIGKIDAEVNMLDVLNVHNKSTFSLSRLSGRILDVGGSFPSGCNPFMSTFDTGELVMAAEPESSGLDGKFVCAKGLIWRFCRLPLQVVHQTDFDFLADEPFFDDDYEEDTTDGDYGPSDRESILASDSDVASTPRRAYTRARSYSRQSNATESEYSIASESVDDTWADDYETDQYHDADGESDLSHSNMKRARRSHRKSHQPPAVYHLMSRQGKRMVNMMEFQLSDTSSHFAMNHGLTPLLKLHSSPIQISLMDQWNDRTDPVGYVEDDGDWSVKLYIDIGERLSLEASSRAIPYLLEMITHLIAFTQTEFKRTIIPRMDEQLLARTPFGRHRRLRSANHTHTASTSPSINPLQVGHTLANRGGLASPMGSKRRSGGSSSQTRELASPMRSLTSSAPASPVAPPRAQTKPLRAGLLSIRGDFLEAKFGSELLEREFVCAEIHDFSTSLQRSLFYSAAQLKEQSQLLQLRRKRNALITAAEEAAIFNSRDGGFSTDIYADLASVGLIDPELIRTEEELAVAIAVLDEETDPLKRLKKRSNEPYRGGLLRTLHPMDVYRTLLVDVGKHYKSQPDPSQSESNVVGYVWKPDPSQTPRHYISQLGANGPGIYVSRLSQVRGNRDQDELDHIFRIPGFVLEMETLDPLESPTLRSRFIAFWDKSITVAIDVRVYKLLQSMSMAFVNHMQRALADMETQAAEAQAAASRAIQEAAREAEEANERATAATTTMMIKKKATNDTSTSSSSSSNSLVPASSSGPPGSATKRSVRFNLDATSSSSSPPPSAMSGAIGTMDKNKDDKLVSSVRPTSTSSVSSSSPSSSSSSIALVSSSTSSRSSLSPSAPVSPVPSRSPLSPRVHQRSPTVRLHRQVDGTFTSQLYQPSPSPSPSSSLSPPVASVSPSVPIAPKLHKPIDPYSSHYDLNNPVIHVLDHATSSSGISVRRIIDILQSLNSNLKSKDLKKEERQLIPSATNEITEGLDKLLDQCVKISEAIDQAFE